MGRVLGLNEPGGEGRGEGVEEWRRREEERGGREEKREGGREEGREGGEEGREGERAGRRREGCMDISLKQSHTVRPHPLINIYII